MQYPHVYAVSCIAQQPEAEQKWTLLSSSAACLDQACEHWYHWWIVCQYIDNKQQSNLRMHTHIRAGGTPQNCPQQDLALSQIERQKLKAEADLFFNLRPDVIVEICKFGFQGDIWAILVCSAAQQEGGTLLPDAAPRAVRSSCRCWSWSCVRIQHLVNVTEQAILEIEHPFLHL